MGASKVDALSGLTTAAQALPEGYAGLGASGIDTLSSLNTAAQALPEGYAGLGTSGIDTLTGLNSAAQALPEGYAGLGASGIGALAGGLNTAAQALPQAYEGFGASGIGALSGDLNAAAQALPQAYACLNDTMATWNNPAADTHTPPIHVSVTEPVVQGEGRTAYVTYKVTTKTSLPQYESQDFTTIRRYSDFAWLHQQLMYPNVVIPPLPEKAVTGNTDPSFVAVRRHGLERFLQRVVKHPVLQFSSDLQMFLEACSLSLAL